jgi:tellurite resistance protein
MRRRLVDACVAAVTADGRTTVEEAELLRAVCAAIGAPMPPLAAAA